MESFFFRVNTQFENLGDAKINGALISLMQKNGDVYLDLSKTPPKFLAAMDISTLGQYRVLSGTRFYVAIVLSLIAGKKTYIVQKPGHVKQRVGIGFRMSLWMKILAAHFLRIIGLKFLAFGNSIDQNFKINIENRLRFNTHTFLGCRDDASRHIVDELKPGKSIRCFDLAFNSGIRFRNNRNRNSIIVSMRESTDDRGVLRRDILMAKSYFNLSLKFVVQVDRDEAFQRILVKSIDESLEIERVDPDLKIYEDGKLVFSNRLHVLLFALMKGCAVIPYVSSVDGKISSLFQDLVDKKMVISEAVLNDSRRLVMYSLVPGASDYARLQNERVFREMLI